MVGDEIDLHVVSTASDAFDDKTLADVRVFGGEREPTVRGSFAAVRAYLRRQSPAALVQLTRPPVHGTLLAPFAVRHHVPLVYRYGGDRFRSYQVDRGLERPVHFGLNNVVGRLPLWVADRHVVLGPTGRERLVERGVDPNGIATLPPTVDLDRFAERSAADLSAVPEDRAVALTVGRRSRRKGLDTMERVIPAILARRDDVHFVFVGGGDREQDLPADCLDHVTVVGPVPPAEMPAYYRLADVLVHPSLNEGLPRAILEAIASETRVIARDVGDVAAATDNVFREESSLIDGVAEFESLPRDDPEPFSRAHNCEVYRDFFGALAVP